MGDTVDQRRQRGAEREVQRIRSLLRQRGGREFDASREEEHYEGGFEVEVGRDGGPHLVGGFHVDPFRVWPAKMRQHAETLTAHGYRVEVREHWDGEILEVTPPDPRSRGAWLWRRLRG